MTNNNVKKESMSFYLIIIGMIYSTIFFTSFVMGYKVISIHSHILCSSVFIFPFLFPINDALTELFGAKTTYIMILTTIGCEFFFGVATYLLASMPSPPTWDNQELYSTLTTGFLHIAFADSLSLAVSFFLNSYYINKWGLKLGGRKFFYRSIGATAIGELVFTVMTNLITFNSFNVANISDTYNIILSDYLLKMIYSLIICIPNAMMVNWIKAKLSQSNDVNASENVISITNARVRYRN
ncbi:VUT family protein [Legionella quinlivanii]|uniref:VUT family protein n=1 Tax=Legionella quinlivanii TaxID=45073 RepID=UPI0022437350|nr:VUT family protein [Legionella quinlivanii]MCW8451908.1 VUT family protein [Legionella quinlivanii]